MKGITQIYFTFHSRYVRNVIMKRIRNNDWKDDLELENDLKEYVKRNQCKKSIRNMLGL